MKAEVFDLRKARKLQLKDFAPTARPKERMHCIFVSESADDLMFRPYNLAAIKWVKLVTGLGWISADRLEASKDFINVEILP